MYSNHISYRKLQLDDEHAFHDVVLLFNTVFETENDVNKENIKKLLNNPGFVCFAAFHHDEVIGGITAYELMSYDKLASVMYIYDLAVQQIHQRKGIGSKLVFELFADCKAKGIKEVFLQTEEADTHAIQFYKQLGGESLETRQFQFNL